MKIAVDAGHGPETAGKRSPDGTLREYQFNSATARYLVERLTHYQNVEVLTTFEDSRDVPLKERTDRANAWGADVFVSIHANAMGGDSWGEVQGIETFEYLQTDALTDRLAETVHRHLIQTTGRPDRHVKRADFHVLRETVMPAILVECGFMDNLEECELLKSDGYRRKCAGAIEAGLIELYGLVEKYADIKGHWAEAYIRKVIAEGKMSGYPDGSFRPDQPLSRAELAVLIANGKI